MTAVERPELLIFLHIPKAAGRSFYRVLDRQVPRESIYQTDPVDWRKSIEELRALPEKQLRSFRIVRGHVGFGLHELFPQQARYVTFVRDPVTRIVSHYRYVLRSPQHYLHEEVADGPLSLLEYAVSGLSPELENGQTRLLAALDDGAVESTPQALDSAKRHISEHFVLAGVTERFDESLLLLRRRLGWASVLYRRENVAPAADRPPDPEAIAAIRERNRLDQDLYEHCARRVEKWIAAEGRSLERELRRFRVRNAVYGSLSASAARARARLGWRAA